MRTVNCCKDAIINRICSNCGWKTGLQRGFWSLDYNYYVFPYSKCLKCGTEFKKYYFNK